MTIQADDYDSLCGDITKNLNGKANTDANTKNKEKPKKINED